MRARTLVAIGLTLVLGAMVAAVAAGAGGGGPIGAAGRLVPVGPGAAESSIRQVVRTQGGHVYVVAADDEGLVSGPAATLRMYRGNQPGVPTSFSQVDAAGAPRVTGGQTIGGGDARLDRSGRIHVAYVRTDTDAVVHQTFSTATNRWEAPEIVALAPGLARNGPGARGAVVTGLAVDRAGTPHVAVAAGGALRVYRRSLPGVWSGAQVGTGGGLLHPSLTFDRQGRLHVAWLRDDGANSIRYALRSAGGAWQVADEAVDDQKVLGNGNLDQSPSIAVDASDNPVVLYLEGSCDSACEDLVRLRARYGGRWVADDPSPGVFAHTPGVHLRGNDRFALLGHDNQIHPAYLTRAAGTAGWSGVRVLAPPAGTGSYGYDGSAASRFDLLNETDCNVLDTVFFDENSDTRGGFRPDLFYAAIRLPTVNCSAVVAGTAGDRTAPRLGRPRVAPRRFSRRRARRARVRFRVSEAGRAKLRVERRRRRRWVLVGRYAVTARAGLNSVRLSRRVRRRLGRRVYRVRVRAFDDAGNRSREARAAFRVVRPRR